MSNSLEINGIVLSSDAQSTLKRWQESGTPSNPSDPERYVEYLSDTQDYLMRAMSENELDMQNIANLLTKLLYIKDDLKLLIPKNIES